LADPLFKTKYMTQDKPTKTAMQILIESMELVEGTYNSEADTAITDVKKVAKSLLEKEKTQIVDAYCQGQIDTPVEGRPEKQDGNQYFTQTYKQ